MQALEAIRFATELFSRASEDRPTDKGDYFKSIVDSTPPQIIDRKQEYPDGSLLVATFDNTGFSQFEPGADPYSQLYFLACESPHDSTAIRQSYTYDYFHIGGRIVARHMRIEGNIIMSKGCNLSITDSDARLALEFFFAMPQ